LSVVPIKVEIVN
jgi:hypothetical protein